MAIPQSFIQELLARVDIVEVVGRYVQLRKGGANFMGLCPFHGEKSPSFSVSPSKQFFHCFGCGKHGNAIGFLMEHTGTGFVDAVKDLAQQAGLQMPQDDASPQDRARAAEQREHQATLGEQLERAAEAYRRQLKASPRAVDYLKRRGLSGQVARDFGLGYAPEGWRFLSTVFPDYQSPLLVESGLVIASDEAQGGSGKRYDRFRDRIMFPIRNVKGECIGFGGRVLDRGEPKYLNSPETPVFSKGHELYGLYEARAAIRQAGYCLVTEGYMDVVALAQLGFAHAVATLGTACTPDHLRKLLRFTDSVVFSFDGDAAGRRAARKALDAALPWASDTRSIRFLFLPPEHDPDSYIREQGPEAFAQAVGHATPLSRFLLESAAADCELDTAEGRARMGAQAQPLWSAMPDGALKRQLLAEIAARVGLAARELGELWSATPRKPHAAAVPHEPEAGAGSARAAAPARRSPVSSGAGAFRAAARGAAHGLLGRADRIARIVLTTPEAWDWLSADDQQLLAQEPSPHGELFAWLETQWHEHGPQPWGALREALRGQPFEAAAVALGEGGAEFGRADDDAAQGLAERRAELGDLLHRLRIEQVNARINRLGERAAHDADARRELAELLQLQRQLKTGNPTARI